MTYATLVIRSLRFYWRAHLATALGAATATGVLVGALTVGDSMRHSLECIARQRLGRTAFAVLSGDRFLTAALAGRLAGDLQTAAAPILQVRGLASTPAGRGVNSVSVLGIDARFGALAPAAMPLPVPEDGALVGADLARRLGVSQGDTLVLRVEQTGMLPAAAPLAKAPDSTVALRLTVSAVLDAGQLGRFSLQANQLPPMNVMVSMDRLARTVGLDGKANMVLVAAKAGLDADAVTAALDRTWSLRDAGLVVKRLQDADTLLLESERLFLDDRVVTAAMAASDRAQGVFSYFVNELRAGGQSTPYAFVSAPAGSPAPPGMRDDEIVITDWLADDLQAAAGDAVTMRWYVAGAGDRPVEATGRFTVHSVVPMDDSRVNAALVPDLPGLAGAETCREWDPGVAIDLSRIREKDERYWEQYGKTPRAFVTLDAARRMWRNRFGALTAVQFPAGERTPEALAEVLRQRLGPGAGGIVVRPVRAEGLRAGRDGVDFGMLFLSLSVFVIVAALLLTGLLFALAVDRRRAEADALASLGIPAGRIRNLRLAEGAIVCAAGCLPGVMLGLLYNHVVLAALGSLWRGAVGTTTLAAHARWTSVAGGAAFGDLAGLAAVAVAGIGSRRPDVGSRRPAPGGRRKIAIVLAVALLCTAVAVVLGADATRGKAAMGPFFAAGALVLAAGLTACRALLTPGRSTTQAESPPGSPAVPRLARMGLRDAARHPGRSLTTVGVLAAALFLVVAVGANRHAPPGQARERASGTGGFAVYHETVAAVHRDLNDGQVRRELGLAESLPADATFVALRVKDGDDASCLNLNRVARPRLLGVPAGELARRAAFTFAGVAAGMPATNPWQLLDLRFPDDEVFGIADLSVITWGLGKAVGDRLEYRDESGRTFRVRLVAGLANSIFQGNVLISEAAFMRLFPSTGGHRVFLLDGDFGDAAATAGDVGVALADFGGAGMPCRARLAAFNGVENTYLAIFMSLGGLGLILGSIGLGVVVARSVLERRRELALLRAVGYSRRMLRVPLLVEHTFLLLAGVLTGLVAALVAVAPAMASPGARVPWGSLAGIAVALTINGLAWVVLAVHIATRGNLLSALRNE